MLFAIEAGWWEIQTYNAKIESKVSWSGVREYDM
jgi:hypothetical protein